MPTSESLPSLLTSPRARFGSIRFPDSRMPPSKFARLETVVDDEEEAQEQIDEVITLLLGTWNLTPPCAMISVAPMERASQQHAFGEGDTSAQLELVLRRGLAEAVAKTNAWVFTSGDSDNPIARMVGNAMHYGLSLIHI